MIWGEKKILLIVVYEMRWCQYVIADRLIQYSVGYDIQIKNIKNDIKNRTLGWI